MTDNYFLSRGRHHTAVLGRCAMEWTAYIAGEPHTDRPECVSPLLRSFCTRLNDSLDDEERQKLRPYLARCIGTTGDGLDERRAWMCVDLLAREFAPTWLDAAGLDAQASSLRSLPPVVSEEAAWMARRQLLAARRALGDQRNHREGQAATDQAAPVLSGAYTCFDAGAEAATGAAGQIIRLAAAQVPGDRLLVPSVLASLQQSIFTLLDRMLPTVPVELPADRQQIALELAG